MGGTTIRQLADPNGKDCFGSTLCYPGSLVIRRSYSSGIMHRSRIRKFHAPLPRLNPANSAPTANDVEIITASTVIANPCPRMPVIIATKNGSPVEPIEYRITLPLAKIEVGHLRDLNLQTNPPTGIPSRHSGTTVSAKSCRGWATGIVAKARTIPTTHPIAI